MGMRVLRWVAAVVLVLGTGVVARGQEALPGVPVEGVAGARLVAPGVWFLEGEAAAGYCNSVVIEMEKYLVLVDPSYPGRARELQGMVRRLSPKPVRYVFDTHAHGDHAYGNGVWKRAGAVIVATEGAAREMERYEPGRWQAAVAKRADVRETGDASVTRPDVAFRGAKWVLRDGGREVDFLALGWAHTEGDGFVWLPRERVLCTGDAAVNGPRNKLWDADVANWPRVLDRALRLRPRVVLPGHGPAGGAEIVEGQARFLRDLYAAVQAEVRGGMTLEAAETGTRLPEADARWLRADMSGAVEAVWREIVEGEPAGSLPHEWK